MPILRHFNQEANEFSLGNKENRVVNFYDEGLPNSAESARRGVESSIENYGLQIDDLNSIVNVLTTASAERNDSGDKLSFGLLYLFNDLPGLADHQYNETAAQMVLDQLINNEEFRDFATQYEYGRDEPRTAETLINTNDHWNAYNKIGIKNGQLIFYFNDEPRIQFIISELLPASYLNELAARNHERTQVAANTAGQELESAVSDAGERRTHTRQTVSSPARPERASGPRSSIQPIDEGTSEEVEQTIQRLESVRIDSNEIEHSEEEAQRLYELRLREQLLQDRADREAYLQSTIDNIDSYTNFSLPEAFQENHDTDYYRRIFNAERINNFERIEYHADRLNIPLNELVQILWSPLGEAGSRRNVGENLTLDRLLYYVDGAARGRNTDSEVRRRRRGTPTHPQTYSSREVRSYNSESFENYTRNLQLQYGQIESLETEQLENLSRGMQVHDSLIQLYHSLTELEFTEFQNIDPDSIDNVEMSDEFETTFEAKFDELGLDLWEPHRYETDILAIMTYICGPLENMEADGIISVTEDEDGEQEVTILQLDDARLTTLVRMWGELDVNRQRHTRNISSNLSEAYDNFYNANDFATMRSRIYRSNLERGVNNDSALIDAHLRGIFDINVTGAFTDGGEQILSTYDTVDRHSESAEYTGDFVNQFTSDRQLYNRILRQSNSLTDLSNSLNDLLEKGRVMLAIDPAMIENGQLTETGRSIAETRQGSITESRLRSDLPLTENQIQLIRYGALYDLWLEEARANARSYPRESQDIATGLDMSLRARGIPENERQRILSQTYTVIAEYEAEHFDPDENAFRLSIDDEIVVGENGEGLIVAASGGTSTIDNPYFTFRVGQIINNENGAQVRYEFLSSAEGELLDAGFNLDATTTLNDEGLYLTGNIISFSLRNLRLSSGFAVGQTVEGMQDRRMRDEYQIGGLSPEVIRLAANNKLDTDSIIEAYQTLLDSDPNHPLQAVIEQATNALDGDRNLAIRTIFGLYATAINNHNIDNFRGIASWEVSFEIGVDLDGVDTESGETTRPGLYFNGGLTLGIRIGSDIYFSTGNAETRGMQNAGDSSAFESVMLEASNSAYIAEGQTVHVLDSTGTTSGTIRIDADGSRRVEIQTIALAQNNVGNFLAENAVETLNSRTNIHGIDFTLDRNSDERFNFYFSVNHAYDEGIRLFADSESQITIEPIEGRPNYFGIRFGSDPSYLPPQDMLIGRHSHYHGMEEGESTETYIVFSQRQTSVLDIVESPYQTDMITMDRHGNGILEPAFNSFENNRFLDPSQLSERTQTIFEGVSIDEFNSRAQSLFDLENISELVSATNALNDTLEIQNAAPTNLELISRVMAALVSNTDLMNTIQRLTTNPNASNYTELAAAITLAVKDARDENGEPYMDENESLSARDIEYLISHLIPGTYRTLQKENPNNINSVTDVINNQFKDVAVEVAEGFGFSNEEARRVADIYANIALENISNERVREAIIALTIERADFEFSDTTVATLASRNHIEGFRTLFFTHQGSTEIIQGTQTRLENLNLQDQELANRFAYAINNGFDPENVDTNNLEQLGEVLYSSTANHLLSINFSGEVNGTQHEVSLISLMLDAEATNAITTARKQLNESGQLNQGEFSEADLGALQSFAQIIETLASATITNSSVQFQLVNGLTITISPRMQAGTALVYPCGNISINTGENLSIQIEGLETPLEGYRFNLGNTESHTVMGSFSRIRTINLNPIAMATIIFGGIERIFRPPAKPDNPEEVIDISQRTETDGTPAQPGRRQSERETSVPTPPTISHPSGMDTIPRGPQEPGI